MAKTNQLKALFFDIFGTCVDWRKTVTETLIDAAKQAGDTTMVQLINPNSQERSLH
jgi:2-haloacid dehalogenase